MSSGTGQAVLHVIPLLHNLLKYHVFQNIMKNGAFALLEQMLHFQ